MGIGSPYKVYLGSTIRDILTNQYSIVGAGYVASKAIIDMEILKIGKTF